MLSLSGSAPSELRPARRLLLSRAVVALASLFLLGGCDVQKSFLTIPVGGYWERLTPPADSIAFFPDWRGDQIVYSSYQGNAFRIVTIRTDGSGRKVQTTPSASFDWTPRWVNDSLVVFSSRRAGSYDIWYLNVRTQAISLLTGFAGHEVSPAPRPGSSGLVYSESKTPILNGRIVLMPDTAAPSLDLHYLSPDSLKAGEPDWDPSGNRVCFSAEGSDTTRHIWLATISPGDTTLIQLTTGPYRNVSPRFNRDGTQIVFSSTRNGRSTLWLVSPAGEASGLRQIATDDPGATTDTPAWSPDGFSLIVASDGRESLLGHPSLWFIRNLGL